MRPLRLTIRGLRSYRRECTIDFRDRGLIAIVGDTGAGKSSILEALTYALYNATTWDQRSVGQLITDAVQSMSVDLEFQAGDQVWQVHRACHRAAGRPSTHRLRCLSDPAAEEYDGEAAVNRQVERLLGMSYSAYRAAVVLPQGRFQTLLHETRAKRTEILEGIFRLTDLRSVRTAAQELARRAGVAVSGLTARREALLPDPAVAAQAVAVELEAQRGRESRLRELQAEVARAREVEREGALRAKALRQHARHVTRPEGGVARRLSDLVPLAAAIQAELSGTAAREQEARRLEEAAAAAAAAAAERGERLEDLAGAVQLLAGVRQTLLDVETAEHSAEQEQGELDTAAAELAAAEAALPDLESSSQAAERAAEAAADAVEKHRGLHRQATEGLRLAREAAADFEGAVAEEGERREALPGLREELDARHDLAREAEAALEIRGTALEEAQRRDAAAHAALGLHPGDPCPVCARPLTEEFQPPSAGALQPIRRALKEAESELAHCRSAETTAVNQLDEAERRLQEAMSRREAAGGAARERLATLLLVLPGADLVLDDAAILGPLDEHGRDLEAAAARGAREAQQARDLLRDARAGVEARRGDHDRRVTRLERERSRLREQRARCGLQLATLPQALGAGEVACAADLHPVVATAERRLADATSELRALDALRVEVGRLAADGVMLRRRFQDEVEAPRGLALRAAGALLLRVNDGLEALDSPPFEAAPSAGDIDAELRWAEELDRRAAELQRRLEEEAAASERVTAAAADGLDLRLREHGLADAEALDETLRMVGRELGRLQAELETAQGQMPLAADLDRRIAAGVEIRDSLSELVRLLQDGQFVAHVIDRRQRQLLIVASQILGSMTGGAYGFSPDFDIVDLRTRQPRPTRTLSGGETFLASLALALALVEIAGRSGTRLDALFLDEGFGSLDASALDDALSALERQASEGRLVAIVSHVRAVAERIETVLEVVRSPIGSSAEWRGAAEREQMLAEELEARLLA